MLYLFDIDGTLIGSRRRAGRRALERACAHTHGLANALEGISLDGKTDPLIVEELFLARYGRLPTDEDLAGILGAYLGFLEDELAHEDSVHRLPAVEEALAAVAARGDVVGLATGNVEAGARLKLTRAGLWHHFAFGGYGSDARDRGELVKVALRRADERAGRALDRSEAWVIGDTPRDVAAAHAAGIRAIGVATGGFDVDALRAARADKVYATLAELVTDGE